MIYAYYEGGGNSSFSTAQKDELTEDDLRAVREQVPDIVAASPMVELHDRISVGEGKQRELLVLGVSSEYMTVRNLLVPSGRFFDPEEAMTRTKVALITQQLARRLFGNEDNAVGQTIKISNLPFTIIGTFKERVETFGQSEIADDTILIPYTVAKYFTGTDAVKQIFFSMGAANEVPTATEQIHQVIQARHRAQSVYHVENLTQLLAVAAQTANALTVVLLLIATVTLIVSGVGIMNIMLANVRSRIREIGIRKAVGATRQEIRLQFLTEAVFISLTGGLLGTLIGLSVPFSVRFFTDYRIPVSGLSAIIAIVVASAVGIIFGTVPATRAAQLDTVEALRYE
jgi:putative ABC transport system permease protein